MGGKLGYDKLGQFKLGDSEISGAVISINVKGNVSVTDSGVGGLVLTDS